MEKLISLKHNKRLPLRGHPYPSWRNIEIYLSFLSIRVLMNALFNKATQLKAQ